MYFSGRVETHVKLEIEDAVHVLDEVQSMRDLRLHLGSRAENMGIILVESTNASKPRKRARRFVTVQGREIGEAHRQLSVRVLLRLAEHKTMSRAVHRLQPELIVLFFTVRVVMAVSFATFLASRNALRNHEHVVVVVFQVARGFPEFLLEDERTDNLIVTTALVLSADEVGQRVEHTRAMGQEERRSGAEGWNMKSC